MNPCRVLLLVQLSFMSVWIRRRIQFDLGICCCGRQGKKNVLPYTHRNLVDVKWFIDKLKNVLGMDGLPTNRNMLLWFSVSCVNVKLVLDSERLQHVEVKHRDMTSAHFFPFLFTSPIIVFVFYPQLAFRPELHPTNTQSFSDSPALKLTRSGVCFATRHSCNCSHTSIVLFIYIYKKLYCNRHIFG